jgi:hypothetical protein
LRWNFDENRYQASAEQLAQHNEQRMNSSLSLKNVRIEQLVQCSSVLSSKGLSLLSKKKKRKKQFGCPRRSGMEELLLTGHCHRPPLSCSLKKRKKKKKILLSVSLHPPRPYSTRSHIHTGPLVIAIATPSLWLTRP